jgi:drug/metabolite transporter (DMT)-like permease
MHAMHLGGSHYTQYLGVSAGITAVLLTVQPLLTAFIASRWLGERLSPRQWAGIAVGFAGVVLVVWHKIDIREMTLGSLIAVIVALLAVTAGTLYQRVFCPRVDLRTSTLIQFIASAVVCWHRSPGSWKASASAGVAHVCGDCISGDMRLDTRRKRAPHIDASWRGDARDEPFFI